MTANIQANNVVLTEGDRLEDTLLKMGGKEKRHALKRNNREKKKLS